MKTNKTILAITVFLALTLFALDACKSDAVEEPSPVGPSSIAVILDLTASPNVILATVKNRQIVTVTATLKKYDGIPLTNRTIMFEIDSGRGSIGYFEDKLEMVTKSTDGEGKVEISYHGPLYSEIGKDLTLYIKATVPWEGSQFISDSTPIYVMRGKE